MDKSIEIPQDHTSTNDVMIDNADSPVINFEDPPIITFGDDLQGILGIDCPDSSIFTDILLRKKEDDEIDREIERLLESPKTEATHCIQTDEVLDIADVHIANSDLSSPDAPSNLASEYESLARSVLVPSPLSVFDEGKQFACPSDPERYTNQCSLDGHLLTPTNTDNDSTRPSNLAIEYESLARSILAPSPEPIIDETKKYACSWCPKRFTTGSFLNRHLSKHTARFTCPYCRRSFARKESRNKHIPRCKTVDPNCRRRKKRKVIDNVIYSCQTCFQEFTRKENYDQHMLKHKGLRVLCHVCEKTFCSWKSFLQHKKLHQFTRTVYFCAHCAAIFMFKSNLQRHLRLTQNAKNIIVCPECNLTLKNEGSLNRHKSQSIKRCAVCSQPFCLEKHLRKHRKMLHPELWFKCKLCDEGTVFTALSEHNLRDHVKKTHNLSLKFMECYEEGWYMTS